MGKFKNLTVGEVLSETQYYKVEKMSGDKVQLVNDNGERIVVNAEYVDGQLSSANQFSKEQKVTRTEMADIMLNNARTAITVNYNKQVKESDVAAELEKEVANAYNTSTPSEVGAKIKKAVKASIKKSMQGVERTMIGIHYGSVNEFGRLQFIDMEEEVKPGGYDNRLKQVDPRTLNWLIVNDIKYVIK